MSPKYLGRYLNNWSTEEDDKLRHGVKVYGSSNWRDVEVVVGTKTRKQCMQRWNSVLKPDLVKGRWTPEEDEVLVGLIREGDKSWHEISKHIPGRTGKQCKARWTQQLDPSISKIEFTKEDDELIIRTVNEVGKRWVQIAKMLPGRTESAVRQRWMQLRKQLNVDCSIENKMMGIYDIVGVSSDHNDHSVIRHQDSANLLRKSCDDVDNSDQTITAISAFDMEKHNSSDDNDEIENCIVDISGSCIDNDDDHNSILLKNVPFPKEKSLEKMPNNNILHQNERLRNACKCLVDFFQYSSFSNMK